MADDESPRPFRRERNLSNRNYGKRGSNRRRQSTESHSSIQETASNETNANVDATTIDSNINTSNPSSPTSTSNFMHIPQAFNSEIEIAMVNRKAMQKMRSLDVETTNMLSNSPINVSHGTESKEHSPITPDTPDPALLGVQQKRLLFENFQAEERITAAKFKSKSTQSLLTSERRFVSRQIKSPSPTSTASSSSGSGLYVINKPKRLSTMGNNAAKFCNRHSSIHNSIDEEAHTEDEVDCMADEVVDEVKEVVVVTECPEDDDVDDFGETENNDDSAIEMSTIVVNKSFLTPQFNHSQSHVQLSTVEKEVVEEVIEPKEEKETETSNEKSKDFQRNYRSRPLTEIGGTQTLRVRGEKFNSLRHAIGDPEDEEQIEMRDKGYKCIQPILDELIKTEETYVENLWIGINNYGNVFERSDLPTGLRGKKYVLFGNVEQIAEFHRDEFLPMLQRNRHDLKRLFEEFLQYVEQNCLYGYVLFTMNKQRSLRLCDTYKNYFKHVQIELDDKLGINSFLVQPIQRMARYPLLLTQFIATLFKQGDFTLKPMIESCCRLEKRMRTLLTTTNESEIINDIVCISETHEFNTFYQGKFRKVSEFHVFDHTLKRGYRSKVFMFDKCILYTEIKGKQLIFHGRYPCEHIGITSKTKTFTLYYEHRKQQECDFTADPAQIELWLELIREMILSYAQEEKKKMREQLSQDHGDHIHRKPANLSLFRDSNRFSTDSGIGNIWIIPKASTEESTASNRTTWYASN